MNTTTDQGVVLQSRPYSEYDAILTLFTKTSGRLGVITKGVRRPNAKLSGMLQPFCAIHLEWLPPKSSDGLAKLIRAEPLNGGLLSADPEFLFIAEVAQKLCREGQGNEQFYQLLADISRSRNAPRSTAIFMIQALTLYGFFPEFQQCPKCPEQFAAAGRWQSSGEIFCLQHAEFGTPLTFDEIKTLRFWQRADFVTSEKVALPPESLQKILSFLISFLETEQEFKLKSKSLILT